MYILSCVFITAIFIGYPQTVAKKQILCGPLYIDEHKFCQKIKSRLKLIGDGGGVLSYRRPFLSPPVRGSRAARRWSRYQQVDGDGGQRAQPRQKGRIILEKSEKILNTVLANQSGSKS